MTEIVWIHRPTGEARHGQFLGFVTGWEKLVRVRRDGADHDEVVHLDNVVGVA